ncbi:MAG: NAD(P)H-dependent oxidoreductase subunit E [Chlamydiales bacterium]|nr:NAD(P)H-dependent oxidoreductase subunit E [Chlamydiales bacterium]
MLTDQLKNAILTLQKKYPEKRSALIPALHVVQSEIGYLPHDVQHEVADLFGLDATEVHAIVTFYDMFYEEPVGKHLIHVCKNASCMLRGCDEVLQSLCSKLKGNSDFTVIPSECLGACDKAPMMVVDEKVVGPVSLQDLDKIIEDAKKGKGHPSPIGIGDCNG